MLERSDAGEWTVDGAPRPELTGVTDVDLEASAVTNTLPYRAPRFGADFDLTLDAAGMVLDYPGLATRIR